ncbi:hypothetical protein [Treponema sp. R6D11]
MTLSERNTFFKIGIALSSICTLFVAAASFLIIPVFPEIMGEYTRRPDNIFQLLTGFFMRNNYYAVYVSLAAVVLYSLISIIFIHFFFERTSSPEILYIAIFTLSFALEAVRFILPLQQIFYFSLFYVGLATRLLLFARYFSIFSLFSAGLCAAGLEVQKTRNVIFVLIIAAMVITIGVPIDNSNWDTSLNIVNSYNTMFTLVSAAAFITTMISFFIAAKIHDTREYSSIAVGVMLALAGRGFVVNVDNWIGLIPGIILLSIGTIILCSKLHKIHLWL